MKYLAVFGLLILLQVNFISCWYPGHQYQNFGSEDENYYQDGEDDYQDYNSINEINNQISEEDSPEYIPHQEYNPEEESAEYVPHQEYPEEDSPEYVPHQEYNPEEESAEYVPHQEYNPEEESKEYVPHQEYNSEEDSPEYVPHQEYNPEEESAEYVPHQEYNPEEEEDNYEDNHLNPNVDMEPAGYEYIRRRSIPYNIPPEDLLRNRRAITRRASRRPLVSACTLEACSGLPPGFYGIAHCSNKYCRCGRQIASIQSCPQGKYVFHTQYGICVDKNLAKAVDYCKHFF